MNCLEFRRQLEAAPGSLGAEARAHAASCPSCSGFERRVARFDATLRSAARIAPPEKLEARVLMRQSFRDPRRGQGWRRAWPALAAGLVLAIAVGLHTGRVLHREAGLQAELLALVEAADYALRSQAPVPEQAVEDALRPVGLDLREALDHVSFAGRCLVRGKLSGHLVLREDSTPISVFLMPGEHVSRASRFVRGGWRGVLVPAAEGTVGIVVPGEESPDEALVERVLRVVRWPT